MKSWSPCALEASRIAASDGGAFFHARMGTPRISTSTISNICPGAVSAAWTSAMLGILRASRGCGRTADEPRLGCRPGLGGRRRGRAAVGDARGEVAGDAARARSRGNELGDLAVGLVPRGVDGPPVGLVDQPGHLGAVDGLPLEQRPGDGLEAALVLAQDPHRLVLLGPQDALDLLVDHARRD